MKDLNNILFKFNHITWLDFVCKLIYILHKHFYSSICLTLLVKLNIRFLMKIEKLYIFFFSFMFQNLFSKYYLIMTVLINDDTHIRSGPM